MYIKEKNIIQQISSIEGHERWRVRILKTFPSFINFNFFSQLATFYRRGDRLQISYSIDLSFLQPPWLMTDRLPNTSNDTYFSVKTKRPIKDQVIDWIVFAKERKRNEKIKSYAVKKLVMIILSLIKHTTFKKGK